MKKSNGNNKRLAHEMNVRLYVAWSHATDYFIDAFGAENIKKAKVRMEADFQAAKVANAVPEWFRELRANVSSLRSYSDEQMFAFVAVIRSLNCLDVDSAALDKIDLSDTELLSRVAARIAPTGMKCRLTTLLESVGDDWGTQQA